MTEEFVPWYKRMGYSSAKEYVDYMTQNKLWGNNNKKAQDAEKKEPLTPSCPSCPACTDTDSNAGTPTKRPRGRPRKNPQ